MRKSCVIAYFVIAALLLSACAGGRSGENNESASAAAGAWSSEGRAYSQTAVTLQCDACIAAFTHGQDFYIASMLIGKDKSTSGIDKNGT